MKGSLTVNCAFTMHVRVSVTVSACGACRSPYPEPRPHPPACRPPFTTTLPFQAPNITSRLPCTLPKATTPHTKRVNIVHAHCVVPCWSAPEAASPQRTFDTVLERSTHAALPAFARYETGAFSCGCSISVALCSLSFVASSLFIKWRFFLPTVRIRQRWMTKRTHPCRSGKASLTGQCRTMTVHVRRTLPTLGSLILRRSSGVFAPLRDNSTANRRSKQIS